MLIWPLKTLPSVQKFILKSVGKRLMPFMKKYHEDGRYVFWPDLETAHYAKNTIATLNKFGIKFVERAHNPPNAPQLRPIEKF
jgi:hypothetical protein